MITLFIGFAIVGLVILGFIAYWVVMVMLIAIGAVFLFWFLLFVLMFNEQMIVVLPCAAIATGLTFWAIGAYSDKEKTSGNS